MTIPMATNNLGADKWALGPGLQLGKVTKKYVIGGFANHQWDVAGSGDADISKTTKLNGRPWKFAVEVNYYVDQPDAYGPEWMIGLVVTPVVTNKMVEWFR